MEKELENALMDLANIMIKNPCENIKFGSYDCYEETAYGFSVDRCLVEEINQLNSLGVKTIGCCCGHNKLQGFIQVISQDINKMIQLGYKQRSIDENGNGKWCFIPKTI